MDEWAKRRRRSYGTIVVDLEERRVIDLLEEATAGAFSAWLQKHPGVDVISRDHGGAFAEGGRDGAPDAVQIADRWHLLKNLGDAGEAFLQRIHRHLPVRTSMPELSSVGPSEGEATPMRVEEGQPRISHQEQERLRRRASRLDRYEAVLALKRQGLSLRAVARRLDLSRKTVRTYLTAGTFPEISARQKRPSILDPHRAYLNRRWQEGCRNGQDLLRELKERGYTGGRTLVADAVRSLRRASRGVDHGAIHAVVERSSARRVSPRPVRCWFVGAAMTSIEKIGWAWSGCWPSTTRRASCTI